MRAAIVLLVLAFGCTEGGLVLGPAPAAMTPPSSATAASRVVTGNQHTCALLAGAIHCWGSNEFGQLGIGNDEPRSLPARIQGDGRYTSMCAGNQHTCALSDLGTTHCWGRNQRGELGQGDRTSSPRPLEVPLGAPATSIACGFANACALLVSGELWCWGQNGEGELAQDDTYPGDDNVQQVDKLSPVRVGDASFRSVGPGDGHLCAVRADGTLWCSGRNSQHQLGPASTREQARRLLQLGSDTDWVQVVSGQQLSCALRTDRSLWCWGTNDSLQDNGGAPLGVPGTEAPTPTRLSGEWLEVATHTFHTCAISSAQELWCWGRNAEGQLGSPDIGLRRQPFSTGRDAISVDVGLFTTCAVDTAGVVACSGENELGQLGTGDLERPYAFTDVRIEMR